MLLAARAQWLKNRLQAMGPAEVLSRLSDAGHSLALYLSHRRLGRGFLSLTPDSDCPLEASKLNGHLGRVPREMQARVLANAAQWLEHRASIFALQDTSLGDPIDWHRDYSSGFVGSSRYSGFINHRVVAEKGNVKYIWELNRLQHLVLLALASQWAGSKAHREEIERQLLSWCVQNPFMRGLNWKSPLEAGIRLINWAFVSFVNASVEPAADLFHQRLRESIYQHQYFLRQLYSKHSSANNHLVGEMAGLYVGSIFWPWYRESRSWRAFARHRLIQEIARQVEPDGVSAERATEYHLLILEFFLLAGALGEVIGESFPPMYWQRLAQMLAFLSAISDRQGNLPIFGDGDSGQVIWLPETTPERGRSLVQLGGFGEGSAAGQDLRTLLLLWGQTPQDIPLPASPMPAQPLQAFPQGGYYVLATNRGDDEEMMVVFDTGPLGLPPLYAHGHADALSFWFSYGGYEFCIDPGTFSYHASPRWRAYFRGTAAHNTVRVDDADQSVAAGPFLWRHVASCQAERLEDNAEFVAVDGCHDGYRRLADPVIHRRRICLYKKRRRLVITDRIECRSSHDLELLFHFSEKCHVRSVGLNAFQASNGPKHVSLHLDSRFESTLYRGSESPIYGWVSRTFDVKEPSFTLVAHTKVPGSAQFITELTAL